VQGFLYFIPWMAAVPLYLGGGIIVTAACQAAVGFWAALGIAIAVSTATKAVAVFALHRACGAVWMKNAGMRKDFELTSVRMRAMEMILSRPGVDSAKVRARKGWSLIFTRARMLRWMCAQARHSSLRSTAARSSPCWSRALTG
jgi:hypothetical protein